MQKLNDICYCEAKTNSGDEFVGIRYDKLNDNKYDVKIIFPMSYFKDDEAIHNSSEELLRECVMNLFSVLSDAALLSKVREDSSVAALSEKSKETAFPMLAYLNVIRNYLDHGYITEREVEYKSKTHGKINWNRTIKMTRPVVTEDEENFVYLDLIARKVNYNEDCLITLVHKFCVHDALNRLGFLFGIEPTEEPVLDFDYDIFCNAVNAKLSKTFNDRDLHLLSDLAKIIEFLAEHQTEDGINPEFYFGVNKFAPVWEAMVDRIFENLPQGVVKDKFNPHCEWNVGSGDCDYENQNYAMRPDTLMWHIANDGTKHLCVLDAKYYKYGMTTETSDLPTSGSICKQIAYAEFVDTHWDEIFGLDFANNDTSPKPIYNAFILPFCFDADNSKLQPDDDCKERPYRMRFFGTCHGTWKNLDAKPSDNEYRPYHRIAGFMLDVKSVMQNYASSENAQKKLAELISGKVC
ncbi:LlaJI family restriction endonuclease [uncultured Fibrobacter sp.]|uniref:LlaJI family restriction endonuclease n=1 Tax=uncultured Fibrobacter sp. TaxID=261512 RepID=UPI0028065165|nr:LlaJI family restriction endonuclease [uncultured Fibrobacter sp.]